MHNRKTKKWLRQDITRRCRTVGEVCIAAMYLGLMGVSSGEVGGGGKMGEH
ncbi:hypothetical protein [Candidatus Spongiihabitans sp.]|uniref:hypothetical protein n=1 Tax=Candidatus Spongiihabitans sp. TaxID=3101308 RepID=UPI003C7B982E